MHRKLVTAPIALLCSGSLLAQPSTQPPAHTIGPTPQLPTPNKQIIPTVHIAPAKGGVNVLKAEFRLIGMDARYRPLNS